MLCTRCKKRTAVVFITAMQGDEKRNEGLCLVCAKELGIPQVREYMEQMGIDDDNVEEFADEMTEFSEAVDGDSFQRGGTGSLPGFIQNLFGGSIKNLNDLLSKKEDGGISDEFPMEVGHVHESRSHAKEKSSAKKKKSKFLDNYCTNLTERAEEGKLDNIIGRDKEIARTIQILTRRQKNNPCLIGEPGVGKTAIAEGIAQKIVAGDVPFNLKNKRVYLLDLTALVAGTQFRGQFESRVKGLIDEVKAEGNVILFIDEVHNLVGAGDSEGSMNAANILKPALSRGEVQVIGATTFKEYRKYIEKDSALERRFQPVTVNEPNISETESVLLGIRGYYEEHHRVKITDELLKRCAVLSERYINDRFLPDKAIDLLDEACACTSIRSKEIGEYDELCEKLVNTEISITEMEEAAEPDFAQIAEARAEVLRLGNEKKELEEKVNNIYVTEADLSKVIELWTGIPASKVTESEYTKIANLEDALKAHIIGQDEAVELV
ncbi:MAG: ATP-dependent Clp protease ATP-binding subunit, partial [Oscillospiraceae bacterium]|nr:ATP-dependent Clp protease ATP-binding subunit [Oscillospiraceae bacterium]